MLRRIEAMRGARVIVVGDVMLDRFVSASVERISPEAPIAIARVEDERSMPGGAANVARNLAALGARAHILGVIGDDGAGAELLSLLGDAVEISPDLIVDPARPTTVKTRYVAAGQQLFRADRELSAPLAEALAEELVARFQAALGDHHAVLLSDYAKGVLSDAVLGRLIAAARAAQKPVIADPKSRDFARYAGVSLLTPNRAELEAALGRPLANAEAAMAGAAEVRARAGVAAVLVTLGGRGMALADGEDGGAVFAGAAREVFDVSGAGDPVLAVLGAALATGAALREAVPLANRAGGIVVAKSGTAVVHASELSDAVQEDAFRAVGANIVALPALLDRIEGWRARRLRVGFTNGCFDLVHPGHISLLDQAKAACDRLIVGLNNDGSVRRLKGEGRPVQGETARAVVLASLQSVDAVTLFDEDTPIKLIETIRPEVLVKGADYRLEEVVGGAFVQGYGGEVLLAEIAPGHSTSETIAKLAGRSG